MPISPLGQLDRQLDYKRNRRQLSEDQESLIPLNSLNPTTNPPGSTPIPTPAPTPFTPATHFSDVATASHRSQGEYYGDGYPYPVDDPAHQKYSSDHNDSDDDSDIRRARSRQGHESETETDRFRRPGAAPLLPQHRRLTVGDPAMRILSRSNKEAHPSNGGPAEKQQKQQQQQLHITPSIPIASASSRKSSAMSVKLILSYVSDWLTLIAFAAVAYVMNGISPNMHPFSLDNETISYPFTESETVPVWMAYLTNGAAPAVAIILVSLILVPGSTVPRGTPRRMIWQRKLWELHIGLLGFCLAQCAAMFVTNGLKNMIGKPRPDLLSRCDPDLDEKDQFTVGTGLLVSHLICRQTDKHKLDDGFRSWPSGHSSTSAAGLLYLSLFLASKFTVTIPFVTPAGYSGDESHESVAAFPSRTRSAAAAAASMINDPESRIASHSRAVLAVRRQAAAPPLYLFGICLVPFSAAVFIACSRWFDYRHHAFDIFTGFLIGTVAAVLGFRYYHMPLSQGAGWAWGPRSDDKAFWAGVGSYSFATDKKEFFVRPGDEEEAIGLGGIGGAGSEDRGNPVSMRQGAGGSIANGTGSDPWGEGGRI